MNRSKGPKRLATLFGVLAVAVLAVSLSGCCCGGAGKNNGTQQGADTRVSAEFGDPEPVSIIGYSGDAMEPFMSRDGSLLLFNDRNDPGTDTNLYYAKRINDTAFQFEGEIKGANSDALDGVASMDQEQNLYFTSTRSYSTTLSTIYTAHFDDGSAADVKLVEGISMMQAPWVNMDSEISADGQTLYYTENQFDPGSAVPKTSDICIATKDGDASFKPRADSGQIMQNVNTAQYLEYAPCTTADQLRLYFTRADLSAGDVRIMVAARNSTSEPFGVPETIGSITGGVKEAPTISPDGNCLYYHLLDNGTYHIYMVRRIATTA